MAHDKIAERLAAWRRIVAKDDDASFRDSLARDGIDLDEIKPLLGDVELASGCQQPSWIETFSWAAAKMVETPPEDGTSFLDPDRPVAFEDLFAPVADEAQSRRRNTGAGANVMSEAAEASLKRALVQELSGVCAPALYDTFSLERMLGAPVAPGGSGDSGARLLYDRYLAEFRQSEFRNFFLDRPVLARLVGVITSSWIETTAQFIRRLEADLPEIAQTFNAGHGLGRVTGLAWNLSDPHRGRQTVCSLTFDCGVTVGYKPKDLQIDVVWMRFLRWLAANNAPPSAILSSVLAKDDYGWVEWLEPLPCRDSADAANFFHRAGAMLCVLHVLGATDFHWENVLATGDAPAPVDLETLLQPRLRPWSDDEAAKDAVHAARRRMADSVLRTGFLPRQRVLHNGLIDPVGGLTPGLPGQVERLIFHNINTDDMVYESRPAADRVARLNIPTLDGKPQVPRDHGDQLKSGFEAMYRFLLDRREALVSPDGPLQGFKGLKIRAVLRATYVYAKLLDSSLRRECVCDGADWSLNFFFLSRMLWDGIDRGHADLRLSERMSLQQMDIPYFFGTTDGTYLQLPDGPRLSEFFDTPSFDESRRRLDQMSIGAMHHELDFIQFTLTANDGPQAPHVWEGSKTGASETTDGDAIRQSLDIAAILESTAIHVPGSAAWIGSSPAGGDHRFELAELGNSLYSGTPGIALFLAALHRITGSTSARTLALSALASLRQRLHDPDESSYFADVADIGGGDGLGGIVYGLAKCAAFLDDRTLLADAYVCADLITPETIEEDRRLDVLSGTAGALLSLLSLYRAEGNAEILKKAICCGRHLLAQQVECDAGRAWQSIDGTVLTGFSHGAAGIAYALLQLSAVANDKDFRSAAEAAIAFETNLYSEPKGGWPDFRLANANGNEPSYPRQWCHGASGIGLARLGALSILQSESIHRDIEAAIALTVEMPREARDHLCCGNFGRLEFLFSAGRRLNNEALISLARARAVETVAHAKARGNFSWLAGEDIHNPGFFTGLSGVGYTLLRFAHPDILPSALLWE